jgi:hypothetical protein
MPGRGREFLGRVVDGRGPIAVWLGVALGLMLGAAPARAQGLDLRGTSDAPAIQPGQTLAPPPSADAGRAVRWPAVARPTRAPVTAPGVARAVQAPVNALPASEPPPARRRAKPEEDAYAPLGIDLGGLTVLPAIEQDIGYDTNPNRISGGAKGSAFSRTQGEMSLRSDWTRHGLDGFLRGSYDAYRDASEADRPEGEGRLGLRLDAARDTQIDLESRFRLDTQRPGSPELGVAVRGRPLVAGYGASAGVTQRFNRLQVGLRGSIDRTAYEDARLTSGATLDQSDRDLNQYTLRLRTGYEVHPGLIPFVEASADARVYDRAVDNSGYRRDSTGLSARVGSTFEITRTLTGEASAGYQVRDYEDERLPQLRGAIADASLVWSATPLTTVRLTAASALDETSLVGSSGAVNRRASLSVQHDLRRNLSVTGVLSIGDTDYDGIRLREELRAASVRVDYKLTRSLVVRSSFTHERLTSTSPGSDYTANVYLVGLRFQR